MWLKQSWTIDLLSKFIRSHDDDEKKKGHKANIENCLLFYGEKAHLQIRRLKI